MAYEPRMMDFEGADGRAPPVSWPGDARLALSLVLNVEEGAELAISRGDERNEHVYEAVEEVVGAPDPCMESHFAYGITAGWPRLHRLLSERGLPVTVNACGRALIASPSIARHAIDAGWEIMAHGDRWERHAGMSEATERGVIARTVAAIAETSGAPPVGWHTRSATTPWTRRLLVEQGGFAYDSNAYDDDRPYVVAVAGAPHVVVPYTFDTNDMRFSNRGGFVHAEDFARYCIAAFDRLHAEGGDAPRMMSVGLHLRIIGKPARIGGLEQFLDHVARRPGVWVARRRDIAAAWRAGIGLPPWAPRAASP